MTWKLQCKNVSSFSVFFIFLVCLKIPCFDIFRVAAGRRKMWGASLFPQGDGLWIMVKKYLRPQRPTSTGIFHFSDSSACLRKRFGEWMRGKKNAVPFFRQAFLWEFKSGFLVFVVRALALATTFPPLWPSRSRSDVTACAELMELLNVYLHSQSRLSFTAFSFESASALLTASIPPSDSQQVGWGGERLSQMDRQTDG